MTSYVKDIRDKVDRVRDDVVPPVAKGAAIGSEKLAEGSEAFAEGARKVADKTRQWADQATGARRRRKLLWMVLALGIVGLIVYFMLQSDEG
ncbi:MAG: hypothetical protein KY394_00455 [Actinobacteria bacterium]|nr:hypothetical protein [Actinomycetota bacterium]